MEYYRVCRTSLFACRIDGDRLLLYTKKRLILPPAGAGSCILKLCLCQTVLQYYFFYMGLVYVTGVHGAIITGTNVFLSILIACLLFGYEQLTGRKLLGCLFGLAGIVLVNLSGQTSEGLFDVSFRGEGFVFIAQIFMLYPAHW